jgi:hypothetical protein
MVLGTKEQYIKLHKKIIFNFYIRLLALIVSIIELYIFKSLIVFFILLISQYGYLVEALFYMRNPYLKHLCNKL